jgi:hypothetical protein
VRTVEVEEVVEGGGGDIASERTDYERNHSPDSVNPSAPRIVVSR